MTQNDITVTMNIADFDELRTAEQRYRNLVERIARCFEYKFKELTIPKECKDCVEENPDCTECEAFKKSPPYEETLTVGVDQLIEACKEYALYGKDILTDIRDLKIIKKSELPKQSKKQKAKGTTINLGGKRK